MQTITSAPVARVGLIKGLSLSTIAACLILSLGSAWSASDWRALFQDTARRLDIQTDLPRETPAADNASQIHLSPELLRLILWGAVILGVAIIVWSLWDNLPVISRSRRIVAPDERPSASSQTQQMNQAQVEADDLAAQGYYNEAMHVLLHNCLHELHRRLGLRFAASLTSREILRRVQLSEEGSNALTKIIQAVEMTYFGGRRAAQADYAACRDYFDALRRALANASPA
jgi:hypothetical protein